MLRGGGSERKGVVPKKTVLGKGGKNDAILELNGVKESRSSSTRSPNHHTAATNWNIKRRPLGGYWGASEQGGKVNTKNLKNKKNKGKMRSVRRSRGWEVLRNCKRGLEPMGKGPTKR